MNLIDIIIVSVYLLALFVWAMSVGLRETVDDFLILSRRAPAFLVIFSMISTWVGVGTTVATAASGYETGISLGITAAIGGLVGVFCAAWFAPRLKWFGDKFSAHTIGDFFVERYSIKSRLVASLLILIIYILLTAAQFVGFSTLIKVWSGIDMEIIIVFAALSTIIYTAFAGIKSDFYTDVVHFFVMSIALFIILLPLVLNDIGGIRNLQKLPESYFDPFAYGGLSFFFAAIIFGAGSAFVTMEIWQRVYASTSGKKARQSLFISIFIIVLFYLVAAFFGLAAKLVEPNLIDKDQAIFVLMKNYLPSGVLGLAVAGFLAIFISTINSTIMVASATITKDFYKGLISKNVENKKLLLVGRISTLIIGLLGLLISILFPDLVALSVNSLFMLLILLPAIFGGFFWSKATSVGATYSVLIGLVIMILFLFVDSGTAFVPGFLASLISFIFISLFSKHSNDENLSIVKGWIHSSNN